eukprot:TRINITY_DN1060_c2_g1_i2.p1 TRINITY_DN1060_c2_g1~~TRINITY_DN1060_c2_g1_i2.p1  ORF type:complete len:293 (-),score=125.87 TRINITY_DN1060_c2_g1_i2:29-907(-)
MSSTSEPSPASKYEIVSQTPLGTGKFSVVFKARRVSDGAPVALKRMQIFDVLDSADRAQLEHEATLLQRLAHPNIIRCYDTYIDKAALELAEYDMKTLITECAGVPMDESLIFHFFVQVCAAVQHMHERRVLHRDLKPGNVFLGSVGSNGETQSADMVKIGDLGLGRLLSSQTEAAKTLCGTPYYMSPEVLREHPYSYASDIWSLGCLLYELCTLKNPFAEGDGQQQTFYTLGKKICAGEYEPVPDSFSPGMRALITSMLQSDPAKRPDINSIIEMAQRAQMEFEVAASDDD